ncbi:hypothetical protein [Miltoncostaea oceani]|uniref:hypothetical protein n=1 Tax=Miltoncostaea oceani TaxID=2843216 RepID=UPI001C3D2968|nr:hypothetical protein [Miltoncostaea oceani]
MSTTRARKPTVRASASLLAGQPRRVSGHVEVENAGRDDVLLRTVEVSGAALGPDAAGGAGTVPVMSRLPAGRSARVPVRLRLDPCTPPGRHEVEVVVGGARTTAVVEVAAHPRARISPAELAVRGAPGTTVTARVVVANLGNVPVPLDRLGAVTVEERGGVCRSLEGALRAEGEHGHRAVLDEAVRRIARTRVDRMRVRAAEPAAIEPGATRAVDLELHLPPDMAAGRTYSGLLRLVGAALLVEVTAEGVAADEAPEPVAPAPSRPRTRRAAPRPRP